MADNGRWFKLWCSSISDPNLDNLDIADFGRWAKLGAYIKEHGTGGEIIISEPSRKIISMMQLSSFNDIILCIKKLPNVTINETVNETVGIVSYKIKYENWLKYQGDYSYYRVKKFHEKNMQNETPKKRREEKRREEEDNIKEKEKIIYPDWLPLDEFSAFKDMRKKIKKPLTLRAENLIIKKLFELKKNGYSPEEVLNQSIMFSWQGVFELKKRTEKITKLSPVWMAGAKEG